jgi:peptide deformylase
MPLSIIYAPNPIFSQKAQIVPPESINDEHIQNIIKEMWQILEQENAIGLAGNLVGVLKRIVIIDESFGIDRTTMINPQIIEKSSTTQSFTEASVSFPGISIEKERADKITVKFLNSSAQEEQITTTGFLATVIQHEIEYLDGITFLDDLSKFKKDLLLAKVKKFLRSHTPHIHGPDCGH